MCISRCHIIFWGDKIIINLGITSWNVILYNVNVTSHQVRRHDLLYVGCNVMTSYVQVLEWCVSLRRMLVCCRELYVCQGFPVILMMDRLHFIAAFLLSYGTRWWDILKIDMNSGDVIPVWRQTDERDTSVNFLLLDEQLRQDIFIAYGMKFYCFNYCWWNIFRHPSIIFFVCNLVNEHSSSLHSFRQRLPHQVCS